MIRKISFQLKTFRLLGRQFTCSVVSDVETDTGWPLSPNPDNHSSFWNRNLINLRNLSILEIEDIVISLIKVPLPHPT